MDRQSTSMDRRVGDRAEQPAPCPRNARTRATPWKTAFAAALLALLAGCTGPANVDPPTVVSVTIQEAAPGVLVGGTTALTVAVETVGGASDAVSWTTSDPTVATVDGGTITGVAAGTASIVATSTVDPARSDAVAVTVAPVVPTTTGTQGGYVAFADVVVGAPATPEGTRPVRFDVGWPDSWRGVARPSYVEATDTWDAIWVFAKYRLPGGSWTHAALRPGAERAPDGIEVVVPNDGRGAFVHRSGLGSGAFAGTGIELPWDLAADGLDATTEVAELRLYALQTIHVPAGAFYVGSGAGITAMGRFRTGTTTAPFHVTGEPVTLGPGAGALNWSAGSGGTPSGTLSASFPLGVDAFYVLRHEVTQGQYVEFLRTLTQTQRDARKHTGSLARYAIIGNVLVPYSTSLPYVPVNFTSWDDALAFADWAGLRPWTELEYEKASHGTAPKSGEPYAWGSAFPTVALELQAAGTISEIPLPTSAFVVYGGVIELDGPVRAGSFARAGRTRVEAGASFYGVLELSGNLSERVVTVGTAFGRAFDGAHGDGALSPGGAADVAGWPPAAGGGLRGGSHDLNLTPLASADRELAAFQIGRARDVGFRLARTAP